jgi:hypothetical protein
MTMFFASSWSWLLFASFALFAVVGMTQVPKDAVTGALQIAKDKFNVRFVFAVMEEDPFSNGEKEMLTVLLSDVPVPGELQKASNEWRLWVSEKAAAGVLHGLILHIDPETNVWDGGNLVTRGGLMFYTESVYGTQDRNLRFEPLVPINGHVAGRLSMKQPMHGMSDDDGPWQVEAKFAAAVVRRAAVTGLLTGQTALDSPQYRAARAFLSACKKKDLEAINASIDPRSRAKMMQMFEGGNREETLRMVSDMALSTLSFHLVKITVRGDTADLKFEDPKPDSGSSQTLHVAQSSEGWKIAN